MTHSCLGRYNAAGCKTLVTSNLLIHVSQYKLSSCFFVVFFNLLCLHMNFHSLFFWLSTIFQLHSLICTDISTQNEYFLQLKGETGSWGDWVVKCSHGSHQRPEFASFMSEVFAFLLEVSKLKILKLIKHRHNATFSVEKRRFWRLGYV